MAMYTWADGWTAVSVGEHLAAMVINCGSRRRRVTEREGDVVVVDNTTIPMAVADALDVSAALLGPSFSLGPQCAGRTSLAAFSIQFVVC